jgi:predicted nucleotidyltransferase
MNEMSRWHQLPLPERENIAVQSPKPLEGASRPYIAENHAMSPSSEVAFPIQLDMRDAPLVINFLSDFIAEETTRNPTYYGALIYGSLSRDRATNTSDIDLIHFSKEFSPFDNVDFPLVSSDFTRARTSIKRTLEEFYDITVHDSGYTGIRSLSYPILQRCTREEVLEEFQYLDKNTVFLIPDLQKRRELANFLLLDDIDSTHDARIKLGHPQDSCPKQLKTERILSWSSQPWEVSSMLSY